MHPAFGRASAVWKSSQRSALEAEVVELRRGIHCVEALLVNAGKFYAGWARLLAPDSRAPQLRRGCIAGHIRNAAVGAKYPAGDAWVEFNNLVYQRRGCARRLHQCAAGDGKQRHQRQYARLREAGRFARGHAVRPCQRHARRGEVGRDAKLAQPVCRTIRAIATDRLVLRPTENLGSERHPEFLPASPTPPASARISAICSKASPH